MNSNNHALSLLNISLSLSESRLLLEALVEQPFKSVFELIGRLNHQAQQFYDAGLKNSARDGCTQKDAYADERKLFQLSPTEFQCCVMALGFLAYNRVQPLLAHLHQELSQQMNTAEQKNTNRSSVDQVHVADINCQSKDASS